MNNNRKYLHGFIDRKGRVVIGPRIDPADCRDYELDSQYIRSRKTHYDIWQDLLPDNQLLIDEPEYHEGLARVEVNGKWGFIDETGAMVIEPIYDCVGNFHNGIAKFGLLHNS